MNLNNVRNRVENLTQRLDHMVPDPPLSASENQKAATDLAALASKLFGHVPDQSLSPFERLERMARGVENRKPKMQDLKSAAWKLKKLRARIDELVPGDATHDKKVDKLIDLLNDKVGSNQLHMMTTDKLELLGDPRAVIAPEIKAISKNKKRRT